MGWKKWIKRTIKKVTKPVSKVFKGVAKGIAKVGKSVMRGVSRIQKKLGPLGMIAMSIAMPYALSGLSSMVGAGAGYMSPATGLMGHANPFLQAVGNIGNTIRHGYRIGSGALGNATKFVGQKLSNIGGSISRAITKTFTKFGGNKTGDNMWTRISKGAKNLFNSAKQVVTGQQKTGLVDVEGVGYSPHFDGAIQQSMKSVDAAKLINADGVLPQGVSFSGQSTGFATSSADSLVTQTINKASENTVNMLDKNSLRYFNDLKGTGQFPNNQAVLDEVLSNQATKYQGITDFDGKYVTDLSKTGDYKFNKATMRPNPNLESGQSIQDASYTFNGQKTFDTPVGKVNNYKEKIANRVKKAAVSTVKDYLFKPDQAYEEFSAGEFIPTTGADSNDGYLPALSSTNIEGSTGSSSYANVFGTEAWQKLKNYHKHMNYTGDNNYYGV